VKSWSSVMISSGKPWRARSPTALRGPGGDAVGIDGDRNALFLAAAACGAGRQLFQVTLQVGAQQAQLLGVLEQQLTGRRGLERAAANDQHRAHLRFQRAQALRHGRLGDRQPLGGTLKTAFFDNGGQAFQGVGVKRAHSLRSISCADVFT
jgi:hypothetical protein